jgi:broad specificity phosphatase PhoE
MTITITYIRHGESEYNSRGILQGVDDPALSPLISQVLEENFLEFFAPLH